MRTRNRWAGALFSSSSNRVVAVAVAREKCHFYSSCTPTANSPSCKYLLIKGALSVLGGPIDLRVSVWFGVFFYVLFASVSVNTTVHLHPIPPIPPLYQNARRISSLLSFPAYHSSSSLLQPPELFVSTTHAVCNRSALCYAVFLSRASLFPLSLLLVTIASLILSIPLPFFHSIGLYTFSKLAV